MSPIISCSYWWDVNYKLFQSSWHQINYTTDDVCSGKHQDREKFNEEMFCFKNIFTCVNWYFSLHYCYKTKMIKLEDFIPVKVVKVVSQVVKLNRTYPRCNQNLPRKWEIRKDDKSELERCLLSEMDVFLNVSVCEPTSVLVCVCVCVW